MFFDALKNDFLSLTYATEHEWWKEVPDLPFDNAGRYSRHRRYRSIHWSIVYSI